MTGAQFGTFILGLPVETKETIEQTIRFAQELDVFSLQVSLAAPYPGTELWKWVQREGILLSQSWDDYAIQADKAHFQIGDLTAELVERKWHEANRRFYLRPSRIARRLMMPDTWRNLPRRLQDVSRMMLGAKTAAGAH